LSLPPAKATCVTWLPSRDVFAMGWPFRSGVRFGGSHAKTPDREERKRQIARQHTTTERELRAVARSHEAENLRLSGFFPRGMGINASRLS
jgi:hypothetical protein